jgi:peptidoglycan hydrolase-like protein with peptidoglycan-binding domain
MRVTGDRGPVDNCGFHLGMLLGHGLGPMTSPSKRQRRIWAGAAGLATVLATALPAAAAPAPASAATASARVSAAAPAAVVTAAKHSKLGARTLRRGDRGKDVKKLQKLLKVKRTGYFNKRTGKAVRKVERKYGLRVDTVVDATTLAAIKRNAKAKKKSSRGGTRGGSPAAAKRFARNYIDDKYGWGSSQMSCLTKLWNRESGWNYRAGNGQYRGIPQTTSGVWRAAGYSSSQYLGSAQVQVKVGARYIDGRYGTPCSAWGHSQRTGWY